MQSFLAIFAGKLSDEKNPYNTEELEKMCEQSIEML
jgi:hypothetical protein